MKDVSQQKKSPAHINPAQQGESSQRNCEGGTTSNGARELSSGGEGGGGHLLFQCLKSHQTKLQDSGSAGSGTTESCWSQPHTLVDMETWWC